jgi:hypothetical protein
VRSPIAARVALGPVATGQIKRYFRVEEFARTVKLLSSAGFSGTGKTRRLSIDQGPLRARSGRGIDFPGCALRSKLPVTVGVAV